MSGFPPLTCLTLTDIVYRKSIIEKLYAGRPHVNITLFFLKCRLPGYHPGLGTKYDFLQSLSKTVSKLSCSARCQAFCVPELWSYCDTDRPFPYWSDFNEHRSAASMKRQPWKAERCINSWRVFNGGLISAGHFKEPLEEELFARGADDEAPWIDCVGFMRSDATLYTDGSRKLKKKKSLKSYNTIQRRDSFVICSHFNLVLKSVHPVLCSLAQKGRVLSEPEPWHEVPKKGDVTCERRVILLMHRFWKLNYVD